MPRCRGEPVGAENRFRGPVLPCGCSIASGCAGVEQQRQRWPRATRERALALFLLWCVMRRRCRPVLDPVAHQLRVYSVGRNSETSHSAGHACLPGMTLFFFFPLVFESPRGCVVCGRLTYRHHSDVSRR